MPKGNVAKFLIFFFFKFFKMLVCYVMRVFCANFSFLAPGAVCRELTSSMRLKHMLRPGSGTRSSMLSIEVFRVATSTTAKSSARF